MWGVTGRWARRCGRSPHAATLAHADAALGEWRGALWGDTRLRAPLWAELRALFRGAALPPALAARWLASRARGLAAAAALGPAEQLALLQARAGALPPGAPPRGACAPGAAARESPCG